MAKTDLIFSKIVKLFPKFDSSILDQFTIQVIINNLSEDLTENPTGKDLHDLIESGDITSKATLLPDSQLIGEIKAKQNGTIAGLPIAAFIFFLTNPDFEITPHVYDGSQVTSSKLIMEIKGNAQKMLTAERTALNYLCHLSGVATLTRKYVDLVAGTKAKLLDTRKTIPGFRKFDKYAVLMGGGTNHRMGLYDMVLIKDNHIDGAGGIKPAVDQVRKKFGNKYQIEVEVKDLQELRIALDLDVDRIMLDNMSTEMMKEAVSITSSKTPLEASGNVSLETVRSIAECGVDYISVGALTHSAPAFDLSMRIKEQG